MLKKYWKPIFYISLVFLALLVLAVIVLRSQKLETDTCTRLEFQGEYSQAGGPWLPLAEKPSSARAVSPVLMAVILAVPSHRVSRSERRLETTVPMEMIREMPPA